MIVATLPEPRRSYSSYRWARQNYSSQRRVVDIWGFVLRILYYTWLDQKNWSYGQDTEPSDEQRSQRRRKRAVWMRETLLELGPTFIKVGQLFSTRADLFPAEYVEELSLLQDQVPAFDYDLVVQIVEQELAKPLQQMYRYFDPTPLAAASLGQVHRAQLHSGENVVVKVQRPGLQKLFSIDLDILRGIASYFQYRTKWGKGGRDWVGIYEECRRTLWEEVDYLREGRNADTFRRNFRGMAQVRVPRVFWRYSTPRLLTLEYLPGIKVSNVDALEAAGLNRQAIARLGAETYLMQVLRHGFFHADPHPGNLAVQQDGSLVFYDFGMMGEIQPLTREKLLNTFSSVMGRNAGGIVDSLVELGALVPTADMGPVRRSIQYMLDNFMDQPMGDLESFSVSAISDDLYELAYDQPFRFPATFTFVMRAFSTLEGLGKILDPDFNFMQVIQPYAAELMTQNGPGGNSFLDDLGRQAAQFTNSSLGLPRRVESTLDKLEQGDLRLRVRASETDRLVRQVVGVGRAAVLALFAVGFLIVATQLFTSGFARLAAVVLIAAIVTAALALQRLLRPDR